MELDIRTLAFVATLSSFLMAVSLSSLWWVNREEKATFYWMAGAFLMAAGFFLIGLRHEIGPLWSIVIANLSILAGYYFQYMGVCVFLHKAANKTLGGVLMVIVGAGFVYFTYDTPDVGMRIVLISWSVALLTLLAAISLGMDVRRRFSLPEALTAMFFFIYAAFMAARGAYALFEGKIDDFMAAGTVHALSLLLIVILSISLAIGYSVMVTVRLNRKLLTEIEVKNRFFSIIAHDLRSPFTMLIGATGLFRKMAETTSREKLVRHAEGINAAATKVFGLVENLLDWSRLQLDQEKITPTSLAVRDVITLGLDPLRPIAETKNITIAIDISEQNVFADKDMLTTVVRNLLDNAIKFCSSGDTISVTAATEGDNIEIAVQDTGQGIAPNIRNSLFEVGTKTTTMGTSGEQGSGLGLPLCRDLLQKNNGDIRIDDTWTDGTRFIITLPIDGEALA